MKKINIHSKNVSVIIILLIVLFITSFILQEDNLNGKIVCFGDSITYGAFVEGNGWVEQLAEKSNEITTINAGRKGRKTSDRNELPPVIEKNKDADYFLFFLGVNDLKDGTDSMVTSCIQNMKWMIEQVKQNIPEAKIVLISPCGINLHDMSEVNQKKKYNENTAASLINLEKGYRQLAEDESIGFISLLHSVSPKNYIDGLHPNLDGQKQIADEIWLGLNKIFAGK